MVVLKKTLVYICTIVLASCSSTKISSSWAKPETEIVISNLNKVLVVAMFKTTTANRIAEDQMASYLNGKGVVSYNYLNDSFNRKNEKAIVDKITNDGFDAAITMRLIDVEKERVYTPGAIETYPTRFRSFGSYYYNSWNTYSLPGYYTTTKTYTIEVNVYSIKEDKIIWTGVTQTTNPSGIEKLSSNVASVVYKKMLKDGFIYQ